MEKDTDNVMFSQLDQDEDFVLALLNH